MLGIPMGGRSLARLGEDVRLDLEAPSRLLTSSRRMGLVCNCHSRLSEPQVAHTTRAYAIGSDNWKTL
jgi:hypothetical protein